MARLPQLGADNGTWGEILNEYLYQSHDGGGNLKDGIISEAKLDASVRDKINATSAGGATNLSATTTATTVSIASDTGTDALLTGATVTDAGVLSAADKTKLNGVEVGATANAADAAIRDRSTHTNTQPVSSVAGLQSSLDTINTTLSEKVSGQNGVSALWVGTQAQYDAIPSPSSTTLYVIKGV